MSGEPVRLAFTIDPAMPPGEAADMILAAIDAADPTGERDMEVTVIPDLPGVADRLIKGLGARVVPAEEVDGA
jgi:hypothetical protein